MSSSDALRSGSRHAIPAPTALLIITLGMLTAVGPFSIDAYLPALPVIAGDLDVGAATVQLTLTACLVGLGLGQLVAGPLGDRFGRRAPILVGIAVYTLASIGCALAPTAEVLVVLRVVQGFAGSAGVVLARATVQDVSSEDSATRLYSQLAVLSGVAPVIAPLIGAAVFGSFGWRAVFIMLAVIGVVVFIVVVAVLVETHPRDRRRSARPRDVAGGFADLLRDRQFRAFVLVSACMAATLFTYIASSPFVLQEQFGLDGVGFAMVFAANGVLLSVVGLTYSRVAHRLDAVLVLRVAGFVQLGGILMLAAVVAVRHLTGAASPAALVIALMISIAPMGVIMPTSTALAMSRSGTRAGSASALLGVGTFTVGGLVSPLSGLGDAAIVMTAVILVSAATGLILAWRATSRLPAIPRTAGR